MNATDGAEDGSDVGGGGDERSRTGLDITARVVVAAFVGGAVGLVAMTPVLVGLPALLGVFQADPLLNVAEFGLVLGAEPSLPLGIVVFAAGGVVGLPLLFVVAGSFLPPREPRALRGVVYATIVWTGFVIAFWPGEQAAVLFMALSLGGHWVYGYALGTVMARLAHVPQHTI